MSENLASPVVPNVPDLLVYIGDQERAVPLAASRALGRNARLFQTDEGLGFKFRGALAGRLVEPGNKADPTKQPTVYSLSLRGGRELTVQVEASGNEFGGAAGLYVLCYDVHGFLVSDVHIALGSGARTAQTVLPDTAIAANFAVELAGKGVLPQLRVTLEGEGAFLPIQAVREPERANAPEGAGNQVNELLAKYRNGFAAKALEDLEEIFGNIFTPARKRRDAAFALVNCHLAESGEASYDRALTLLDFLEGLAPVEWMAGERLLLKVEALLGQSRAAEARLACLAHVQRHGAKSVAAQAMVNALEADARTPTALSVLNRQYAGAGVAPIRLINPKAPISLANIVTHSPEPIDGPLVTVIVPVYNGAASIDVCLNSIRAQSWRNLEILVSDDASDDGTTTLVERHAAEDDRIRLIRNASNGGPYVARNVALAQANGDFVTTHDADDWSHPQKLEIQVGALLDAPESVGNVTAQLRVDDEFRFQRRGRRAFAGPCLASFLFRREVVTNAIGSWDPVRFGADAEFIARVRQHFGDSAVMTVSAAPLTLMHLGEDNLTNSAYTRYSGFKMGARKEYEEAARHWYARQGGHRVIAGQSTFPTPALLQPSYRKGSEQTFDVVLGSDFRLSGGTNQSNIQELMVQRDMGLRTGLVQLDRYNVSMFRPISPKLRDVIDGDLIQMVNYGQTINCDLLLVRHPPVLDVVNDLRPRINAKQALVIVNEPPTRAKNEHTSVMYEPRRCEEVLATFATIAGEIRWAPIGPVARDAFEAVHPDFPLSDNWVNILDFREWAVRSRVPAGFGDRRPIIGRHSRDQYTKWPEDAQRLTEIYVNDHFETRVLGGADTPSNILGAQPTGWTVYPFDGLPVIEFLQQLDFYVYFTHSQWDEAFGRTILEALALGLPVIAERKLEKLFGDSVIYAEPEEVAGIVSALWRDPGAYMERVRHGAHYVRTNFSTSVHVQRLSRMLGECRSDQHALEADASRSRD